MHLSQVCLFLGAMLAVRGQDPTTVCFPPVFQTPYFNMITGDKGTIFVDFGKELWCEISTVTGVRMISDFANLRSYAITGTGNDTVCQTYKLRQSQIMTRCLPPYATEVTEATGYLHHLTANRMFVKTWDIPTEYDSIFRVVFSVVGGQPYWPIMSQQYGYHGTTDLYIYTNPAPTITPVSVFTIPADCLTRDVSLATIVG